jgi:hypothetical protein
VAEYDGAATVSIEKTNTISSNFSQLSSKSLSRAKPLTLWISVAFDCTFDAGTVG